ncbi:MAG: ABC transporter ATP-binding protein [Clostridia bacterium]|nr:ABC transporter ATP-binding protein [Clostridia bacterium]MDR3645473.1 ABC transporter ATP-binding protein [Clostridia bacterium]
MDVISLRNISISFDGEPVLKSISLNIRDKEFITLLGPSGCGKTTTLRIIGGFTKPDRGDVFFDGQRINGLPPYKRHVNTVFQRYALFPHLNVFENIAFGLRITKTPEKVVRQKVGEMLSLVNLSGFEKRQSGALSGGQQQRVAIARALINKPRVLLLDEPLGALDLKLRKEMQGELKNIQKRSGITFIYVTHDQEEALTMSDTVVVMNAGEILQVGTPEDIYNEPRNAFVADFIGESNIIPGVMPADFAVDFCGGRFECVDKGFEKDEPVDIVLRPEDLTLIEAGNARIHGVVRSVTFKGVHYEIIIEGMGCMWTVHSTDYAAVGTEAGLEFEPFDIHIMHKS